MGTLDPLDEDPFDTGPVDPSVRELGRLPVVSFGNDRQTGAYRNRCLAIQAAGHRGQGKQG
jgi:hypothetical protein